MKQNIVIYQDEGVGEFGLKCLEKFFAEEDVWLANAEAIVDGRILQMADIFVMPGGADLPYCKKLNGAGNDNIRAFVEDGGTYLGICAGAYYACKALEFHKGRDDEIVGKRELSFTDSVAYGSLPQLASYYDLTLHSAAVTKIDIAGVGTADIFYHGGPAFRLGHDETDVLARYQEIEGAPPAIIETEVGDGRALLLGVHAEMSPELLRDYPVKDAAEKLALDAILSKFQKDALGPHRILKMLLEKA